MPSLTGILQAMTAEQKDGRREIFIRNGCVFSKVDLGNTDLTAFLGNRGSSYRGFDPALQGPARRDSRSNGTDQTVWE
ncbi:hypothetical protein MGG_16354 [Pyricularia oryzae 70-15]|uniref:Uncharacterized protein n=3 Tax=Pyricularia oryzae TaxID=318829 RepID=G4MLC4_PYRO7|nr:uncharacterized protein MGG_16354 [Pyricularia oryzae 70-15]EHA57654.1 hypothetical protein MGG_16354 [Pyricularia oryzae 70-15]ELQ43589.1 hypothetical protein OOU_Y34scaffold00141g12 [Pyricularia oryzae Y34]